MTLLLGQELNPPIAVAATVAATSASRTSAITRDFNDLDAGLFAMSSMVATGIRTALIHPMTLALARKQALNHNIGSSTVSILLSIVRLEGGYRALTQGLALSVLGVTANETIGNVAYEFFRSVAPLDTEIAKESVGGFFSDALGRSISTPIGLIANRQMIAGAAAGVAASAAMHHRNDIPRRSAFQHLRSIIHLEGIRGLAAGLPLSLLYGGIWSAAWWPVYGAMKRELYEAWRVTEGWISSAPEGPPTRSSPFLAKPPLGAVALGRCCASPQTVDWDLDDESEFHPQPRAIAKSVLSCLPTSLASTTDNIVLNGAAAAVSSGVTAVVFNPCLVVITRVQVTPGATARSVCRSILREHGIRGFFAGSFLNVSTCVVDGVLAAGCYEWARRCSDRHGA